MSDMQQLTRNSDNAYIERLFARGDLASIKDLYNEKLSEVFISMEMNDKLMKQIASHEAALAALEAKVSDLEAEMLKCSVLKAEISALQNQTDSTTGVP